MNQKVMKNLEMLGAAFTLQTNIPAYQSCNQLTHHQQLLTASLKETAATTLTGRRLPLESCQQLTQHSALN